ncbi:ABC transporter substrate-binding protein [Pedobacter glucosidilyticus]|uniref:ABC transporter substrate-binding protein n=1 Tax=Pedobacter glucosidilyticus TaxID=1122941 RepID=UPI0026F28C90|nr:ABC transporter substrate-binding protein [Pedobacter glucosidilyticus]
MRFLISFLTSFLLVLKILNASEKDTIKLQLKWRHQFQFAGYYAALIKGYYKEEGLNVQLISGGPSVSPINEVLRGRADIAIFDPNIILRNSKKNPLVVLATIMQSSPYVVLSLKEKNILKPSDLIGKTILADQDQGWNIVKATLLKEGIKEDLINIIPRKKDSEEIADGKADAVVTYITTQPQRLHQLGLKLNMIRPVEYGVDFYGDVLFTTKSFAYHNTQVTDGFIRATLKGWEYALAHEDEMITYILTLPGVKEYGNNKAFLKVEAAEVRKLIMPDLVQIGHMNLGRWQYMLQIYQQLGIANKDLTLKDFIYNAEDRSLSKWLKPLIYLSIVVLIVIVIISFINWQLRKRVRIKTAELSAEIESRKAAESLAKRNEQKLKLAIKSANIGLWDWDLHQQRAFVSKDWCEILGITYQETLNQINLLHYIHPDDRLNVVKSFLRFRNSIEKQQIVQFRLKSNHGDYLYVMASFTFGEQISKHIVSGIVINIDTIKRKEFQLIKVSEELLRSNNELKKFAYITSHNLRAPIVNLETLFNMLHLPDLNHEQVIIIDKINISIQKLSNVLNDLIEIVSHQIASENKYPVEINLEEEFVKVITSLEPQIVKANAKIRLYFEENVLFYPKQYFESAIYCLLTNALKYKSNDRNLEINISALKVENQVVLKVSDNGLGIDMKKNGDKIFGLYQRFHENIEGKGLGLFILKSHLESLGASIEVSSQLNVGSTFILRFNQFD